MSMLIASNCNVTRFAPNFKHNDDLNTQVIADD